MSLAIQRAFRLRRNFLPRRLIDAGCFLLIFIFTPITFIFDVTIVLPAFHEFGSFFYIFTLIVAVFLVFQIKSNLIACILIDTSVDFSTVRPPEDKTALEQWHECEVCEKWAPPRSHHCKVCGTCIMKRDHHCLFTGCCIGHLNHRYFMVFVVYLFIGSTYALVYNSLYLWSVNAAIYRNWLTALKMFCPLLMLVIGTLNRNFCLIVYNLNLLAFFYSVLLLVYHGNTIWKGGVCYERGRYEYRLSWRKNLEMVFGKQMKMVWLSPLIRSDLPHDGIHWTKTVVEKSE